MPELKRMGKHFLIAAVAQILLYSCSSNENYLQPHKDSRVALIGNNLGSRMMNYGFFETELQVRFPDSTLLIRNMCDGGNTPGFRPHSGRETPWAFPGAQEYFQELAKNSGSKGHFETPDQWLTRLNTDMVIAFFGFNESYQGESGLERFRGELQAFITHTLSQQYNGQSPPQLALVSPTAFEDLSQTMDLPDGTLENKNLALYTEAMKEVAQANNILFVDLFHPSSDWMESSSEPLTIDGLQLNEAGYKQLSTFLADQLLGKVKSRSEHWDLVHEAVQEKNWVWHNDFKIPNGVHVFGRRYNPFGPDNYPAELTKIREMTDIRDQAIWKAAKGEQMDLAQADQQTSTLPPVETNFKLKVDGETPRYLYGEEALATFTTAPGYKIELFASETEFPDLANPVQMSFDAQGRLWIATMPSYPHWKPGDPKPNDKIIILTDEDGDGKADKQITYADNLHLPTGFEITHEGVFVSQGTNLVLLKDTDGDDYAESREIILSGFDDHDTHHVISAYCADPSGAIYMGEGVFLHTNVETPYGTVRGTNGGFYRYNPARRHLERTAQIPIPNPWGIAFDRWGQNFFAETSGPDVRWMMPASIKSRYGVSVHKSYNLIEDQHRVRPTSGLEFVSSRHFPDEVQGDLLINNTIGFLGTKQHMMMDDGTGYVSKHRHDLVQSTDINFRPVDMEFAPDGSLYLVDWHNILVGHMQHNARDPLRDHSHGRIYRITYPARPLVTPAKVHDASIKELLDNLKLPEYRTRYRSRRELRGRDVSSVLAELELWTQELDSQDPDYEHHLLEALWVSWGMNQINRDILDQLMNSDDYRVRSAAVRAIRYMGHQLDDQAELLIRTAGDQHGRVRLESIVAASWMDQESGMKVIETAREHEMDKWMVHAFQTAEAHLNGKSLEEVKEEAAKTHLEGADLELFMQGKQVYERDGSCMTCHQVDGKGLDASGFPPLAATKWVLGSEERLIKIALNGLYGPITVLGKEYAGTVPMTPNRDLLNDQELAGVLTYVRNAFGNKASVISVEKVKQVRQATLDKQGFYTAEELLKQHPHAESE